MTTSANTFGDRLFARLRGHSQHTSANTHAVYAPDSMGYMQESSANSHNFGIAMQPLNPEHASVRTLVNMGFTQRDAISALHICGNDVGVAANRLLQQQQQQSSTATAVGISDTDSLLANGTANVGDVSDHSHTS